MIYRIQVIAAAFVIVILGVLFFTPPALAQKSKVKYLWKLGTVAPKGVGHVIRFQEILRPAMNQATDGELNFKIYAGAIMGDDEQHLQKMRAGQLQGAGLSGQGSFMLAPEIPVLGLPFLFNDYKEVDYLKHKMINVFDAIVERHAFRMLAWLDQDFDQIYSNVPIVRLEDFSKTTFLTWFGPLEGRLLKRLGSQAIPMGVVELPSSIRAGVAKSLICPAIYVVGTQLYSQFSFVNSMKIRYVPGFTVASVKAWDELPARHQQIILKSREQWAIKFNEGTRIDTQKCLQAIIKYGIKDAKSSPEDLEKIKAQALPLWDELIDKMYPEELLDEIKTHLADYRSQTR